MFMLDEKTNVLINNIIIGFYIEIVNGKTLIILLRLNAGEQA